MKKLYNENRTLFIILAVAVGCILISLILLLKYFYFGNGQSKYGDRLQCTKNTKIDDNRINDIKSSIQSDDKTTSININISGKIVYIKINFIDSVTLVDAQTIAVKSLEQFNDEEKKCYDFEYTLYQDSTEQKEGFRIMGAKNVNGTNLVWNNNNATINSIE